MSSSKHISLEFKQGVLAECKKLLDERISAIHKELDELSASMSTETKSTAGDKHETGRAMMQLEREKIGKQLGILEQEKLTLEKIRSAPSETISSGALVETNNGLFFIALPPGRVTFQGREIFIVSQNSPLGQKLVQNQLQPFDLNGKRFEIKKVI